MTLFTLQQSPLFPWIQLKLLCRWLSSFPSSLYLSFCYLASRLSPQFFPHGFCLVDIFREFNLNKAKSVLSALFSSNPSLYSFFLFLNILIIVWSVEVWKLRFFQVITSKLPSLGTSFLLFPPPLFLIELLTLLCSRWLSHFLTSD